MADTTKFQEKVKQIKDSISNEINVENVLALAIKTPGVKINRTEYLTKELKLYYPQETVDTALERNPAYAGIPRSAIDIIAKRAIDYETSKVTAISFAAGIPGGVAMAATVPADLAQYFAFILRIMQKLAYLYGFEEFDLNDESIDDETMCNIMVFLGIMFGVQEANAAIKVLASSVAQNVAKKLGQKALMKTAYYPIVKRIATLLGIRMTKDIFAKSVSKVVPVIGGVATGTLTFVTFKPNAVKLKKKFAELPISDPEFYRKEENVIDV